MLSASSHDQGRRGIAVALVLGLAGCGARTATLPVQEQPALLVASASASLPAASSTAPPASASDGSCWKVRLSKDGDENAVGKAFVAHAAKAFEGLDQSKAGTSNARLVAQLRSLGIGELGPLCASVEVIVTRPSEKLELAARFEVQVTVQKPATRLTISATLPMLDHGVVAPIDRWSFVEPVERTLGRALIVQGLASAFEASREVRRSAVLKLSAGFMWGWARSADHVSQCVLAVDGTKRWCWRSPPQKHGPSVFLDWTERDGELRGFIEPTDGAIWAVALPAGTYARVSGAKAWPSAGFSALPNDDASPGTAALAFAHERSPDGAYVETEVGGISCRLSDATVSCFQR